MLTKNSLHDNPPAVKALFGDSLRKILPYTIDKPSPEEYDIHVVSNR